MGKGEVDGRCVGVEEEEEEEVEVETAGGGKMARRYFPNQVEDQRTKAKLRARWIERMRDGIMFSSRWMRAVGVVVGSWYRRRVAVIIDTSRDSKSVSRIAEG
jgi:hypothetical protein